MHVVTGMSVITGITVDHINYRCLSSVTCMLGYNDDLADYRLSGLDTTVQRYNEFRMFIPLLTLVFCIYATIQLNINFIIHK